MLTSDGGMKMAKTNYVALTSDKKKSTAYLLCLFGGLLGLHQFYVGKTAKGILYACTLGLFCKCYWSDLRKIRKGKFTDNVGMPLRQ